MLKKCHIHSKATKTEIQNILLCHLIANCINFALKMEISFTFINFLTIAVA